MIRLTYPLPEARALNHPKSLRPGILGKARCNPPKSSRPGKLGKARCQALAFRANRSLWPTRILYLSRWVALRSKQTNEVHMNRLAYTLSEAARIAGVGRTRIFEAVCKQELTIRKAGRA
jgi:hypothetical protein